MKIGLALSAVAGAFIASGAVALSVGQAADAFMVLSGALAALVVFLASAMVDSVWSCRGQFLGLAAAGVALAVWGREYQAVAVPFFLVASALALGYRLVRARPASALVGLLAAGGSLLAGGAANGRLPESAALVVILAALGASAWWIIGPEFRRLEQRANRGENIARLGSAGASQIREALVDAGRLRAMAERFWPLDGQGSQDLAAIAERLEAGIGSFQTHSDACVRMLRESVDPLPIIRSIIRICAVMPRFRDRVHFVEEVGECRLLLPPADFRLVLEGVVRQASEAAAGAGGNGMVRITCDSQRLVVEDRGRHPLGGEDFPLGRRARGGHAEAWERQAREFCRTNGFTLAVENLPETGRRVTIVFSPTDNR
jgi:hypothetical protein